MIRLIWLLSLETIKSLTDHLDVLKLRFIWAGADYQESALWNKPDD